MKAEACFVTPITGKPVSEQVLPVSHRSKFESANRQFGQESKVCSLPFKPVYFQLYHRLFVFERDIETSLLRWYTSTLEFLAVVSQVWDQDML